MSDGRRIMYGAPPPPRRPPFIPMAPTYIPTPPGEDPQRPDVKAPDVDLGELLAGGPVTLSSLRRELRAAEESIKAAVHAEHAETRESMHRLTDALTKAVTSITLMLVEVAESKAAAQKAAKKRSKKRAKR